jgi:hypothetical protein
VRLKVRHVISALEEVSEHAEELDKDSDDGAGDEYAKHVGWTIQFLIKEFHEDDILISFE